MDEHGTGEPTQPYGAPRTYGGTPEVLDSAAPGPSVLPGSDPAGPGQAGQGHGRRTGIVAAVVVGALLVSGGAFAAWSRLNHSADGPAQVLPSGTVAVLEVNLDPSAAQKVALLNLLRKLPGSSGLQGSDGTFQDWVGRTLSEGADSGTGSSDGLDFAHDVQPWLGSRVAVAAVSGYRKTSAVDAALVV